MHKEDLDKFGDLMFSDDELRNDAQQQIDMENPYVKYAVLIGEYKGSEEGTFIIPSESGEIIRLFKSEGWRSPDVAEGFIRLCTTYNTYGGVNNDTAITRRNSMNFKGEVRTLKSFMNRWLKKGEIKGIVAHVEFTESEIESNEKLTLAFKKNKFSQKMLPARDGRPETALLYNGEKAYMMQDLAIHDFDPDKAQQLTRRLEVDDDSARRSDEARAKSEATMAKGKATLEKLKAKEAKEQAEAEEKMKADEEAYKKEKAEETPS